MDYLFVACGNPQQEVPTSDQIVRDPWLIFFVQSIQDDIVGSDQVEFLATSLKGKHSHNAALSLCLWSRKSKAEVWDATIVPIRDVH